MIVHGIPGPYELADGDILSVDVGVTLDGFVADSAYTFADRRGLRRGASGCSRSARPRWTPGSSSVRPAIGSRDISHAVQQVTEAAGFSVVRTLVGHGVGRSMHEDPQIPNYGQPGRGPAARRGDDASRSSR